MNAQPDLFLFEKLRRLWAQTMLTGDDIELDALALKAAFRARALMRLADLTEVLERVEDVYDLVDAANLIVDISDAKREVA